MPPLRHLPVLCVLAATGLAQPPSHWAYRPVQDPPLPAVERADWPRCGLDHFVLAALEERGLPPSPPADPAVLLRRASLDLTGLPPTPDGLDALLADKAPGAWERAVDRLLSSPHFGERWARMWLDLARYADTKGYEKDARRNIWRWRDWVIDAFNRDLPFDEFTVEQLAGDLLPQPDLEQLVATAFHRNTMTNDEGGTDDEEFRVAAVNDRVATTFQVWMGTTMACAQCHDHKYDPITQREYFEVFAFFDNTADADRPDEAPVLRAPTAAQRAEAGRVRAELEDVLSGVDPEAERAWRARMRERLAAFERMAPEPGVWSAAGPFAGESMAEVLARPFPPERGAADVAWQEHPQWVDGRVHTWRGDNSARYLRRVIRSAVPGRATLALGSDDGIKVWVGGREVFAREVSRGAAPAQELVEVELREGDNEVLLKIANGRGPSGFCFELRATALPAEALAALGAERPGEEQRRILRDAFVRHAPEAGTVRGRVAELRAKLDELRVPTVPIMRELQGDARRQTHVHVRGSFLQKGEAVAPGVPAAFHPWPEDAPRDRLGLARWLVDPANPLTARVQVNRFWEELFGTGLVRTSEDFGTQGEAPDHPELLDHLASRFVALDWSVKALLREIVTSATYRQSSSASPELLAADPTNRWLARGPSLRLSAEAVRDQALLVSGLLSRKIGGPSVMPPQPEGVWQVVYSNDRWRTSEGEDRYRRGLYTFWRRTSPHPAMVAFDAPSREFCVVRRERTNTPLQALVTLNDPVFVEAAQALARRMAAAAGEPSAQVVAGFERCLLRAPRPVELDRLLELYESERAHYAADVDAACELCAPLPGSALEPVPESDAPRLAALTVVANVLLNLDELLTKS